MSEQATHDAPLQVAQPPVGGRQQSPSGCRVNLATRPHQERSPLIPVFPWAFRYRLFPCRRWQGIGASVRAVCA